MARKASSRKPTLALPKPFARSPTSRGKPARGLSASEAADAAQQGLLQLSFARHAHGYGCVGAAAFLLDAILILYIGLQAPVLPTGVRVDFLVWLLPSVAGAVASWDAVRLKREPYRKHYESTHFAMSTVGMALFFVTALAIVLMIWQQFPAWLDPGWVYPFAVAGVPLTIISMGMTWEGLGLRKAGSFVLAAVTPVLALFLPFGHFTLADQSGRSLYVVTLLIGALSTEFAGSLLHIIASSTSVYQREILKADISTLKTEHEKMRQTLNAREASLAEREKEVKRTSIELTSQLRSSETKAKSVEEREARLQELEKSFDSKRTSLLKKEKDLELKDSELRLRGEQVEATHGGADATRIRELKEWEKKILAKEKELGKQEVELKTMETRLKERYENATRVEKQFQGQRRMFDDRESEYVSREKKISDQEAALRERSTEIERQASAVEEAQHQLDDKTKKYAELFKDTKMKEAAAGSNEADTRRQKE